MLARSSNVGSGNCSIGSRASVAALSSASTPRASKIRILAIELSSPVLWIEMTPFWRRRAAALLLACDTRKQRLEVHVVEAVLALEASDPVQQAPLGVVDTVARPCRGCEALIQLIDNVHDRPLSAR